MKKIIIGVLVTILLVGGFFGYREYRRVQAAAQSPYQTVKAATGDLTAIVGATGTVHANQAATLTWQTSGVIAAVNYQEGDLVKAGDVIASLDPTSLPQAIILAQADLITARRNLQNLQTSQTSIAQAQQALTTAQAAYDKAKNHREGLNYPRASQNNIDNAYSQYQLALSNVATAQDAYDRVSSLPSDNLLRVQLLSQLTSAQLKRDQALANFNWLSGKPTAADVADADSKLAVAKAQLDDAQREYDRVRNGPDPSDVSAAQARVNAIQATLNLTRLSAPFTGTITDLHLKPGDLIGAAQASAVTTTATTQSVRIEDLSHMLVDVQVTEVDINRVSMGQPVTMTFDAILGIEYNGKVIQVARTGTTTQGVVNFIVTVEITDPDESIRPGMTAAVNITVNQIKNVLVVPSRAVRLVDGQRVIYLLKNGTPTQVPVKVGASSDTSTQILGDSIHPGDEVVLNPPTTFSGGPGGGFFGR